MTLATALVTGNDPLPALAEEAVRTAMVKASLDRPNGVLLFLTPEFARHAPVVVMAAARVAQCTQVAGGIASGVFTELGSALDRPAAAVMVFGDPLSLDSGDRLGASADPLLCYSSRLAPAECPATADSVRFGGGFSLGDPLPETFVWQRSRMSQQQRCCLQISAASIEIATSSGLQRLGARLHVDRSNGFDLLQVGGQPAARSAHRALPATMRDHPEALHRLVALHFLDHDHDERFGSPLAIVAVNQDESLTLSEPLSPGESIAWAMRDPDTAVCEMAASAAHARSGNRSPIGALVFSCIGRGPYFYGGEDRDLKTLRDALPAMPILGVYGTMQLAPIDGLSSPSSRTLQNSVVSAFLYSR